MLTALSVRDIVLIERLDLALSRGLTVVSGETGAGKSILLDALGLALGARGDAALVRAGADRGVVTAAFSLPRGHAAFALLENLEIAAEGEIVVRRVQNADGKARAFLNDQPVSVGLLRQLGALLAEIHGQHDDRALLTVAEHRRLLDAFGGLEPQREAVAEGWRRLARARAALAGERERRERAEAERAFIEHAVEELGALAPAAGEEDALAGRRQLLMHAEQFAALLAEASGALSDDGTLEAQLNAALRKMERRRDESAGLLDEPCAALERVVIEMAEAQRVLAEAQRGFAADPRELERVEERLFALRAAARKHKLPVDELPGLLERYENELAALEEGSHRLACLEREERTALDDYRQRAKGLSEARTQAARRLDAAVMGELAPLRLERARFTTRVDADPARQGPDGFDRVEFSASANPGLPLGPLARIASGGELSRFMLALKVVLAGAGSAPTLIFDEIDTGVGGAVADAIGQRLAKLAEDLQVLAVTHSPQVAARADHHMLISKLAAMGEETDRMVTQLRELTGSSRREEIARMLSAAEVTEEARAQAQRLLAGQAR